MYYKQAHENPIRIRKELKFIKARIDMLTESGAIPSEETVLCYKASRKALLDLKIKI